MKVGAVLIYGVVVFCLALMYMAATSSREGFSGDAGYRFIMMHMPGCGHCEKAMPEFDEFAKGSPLTINGKSVSVSKIDGVADAESSKKFGVDGFPTFVLVKPDGSIDKYSGERNPAGYKAFLQSAVA
jgi:thiol-disulfide isomerase/thioredoxin